MLVRPRRSGQSVWNRLERRVLSSGLLVIELLADVVLARRLARRGRRPGDEPAASRPAAAQR